MERSRKKRKRKTSPLRAAWKSVHVVLIFVSLGYACTTVELETGIEVEAGRGIWILILSYQ